MQFHFEDITSSEQETASALEPHGQSCLADTEQPALSEPDLHGNVRSLSEVQQDLMELIVEPENLERAWQQVRSNRSAAGPDGMSIGDFPDWCRAHWPTIRQQLQDGTYRPQPVRRVTTPKPDGGFPIPIWATGDGRLVFGVGFE